MPKPDPKSGRSQLNVWVKNPSIEYIKQFAKERGYSIGAAVDRIIELHRYEIQRLSQSQQTNKENNNEATDNTRY